MYTFVTVFNLVSFLAVTIFYFYQVIYTIVGLFCKSKSYTAKQNHKYGVLVMARNESAVIAQLIESIKKQKYPEELVDVFVVADNCTDNTAEVAEKAGATVFVRKNEEFVGKGYALDFAFDILHSDYADCGYEGWFIVDADNLLDENYIKEMNSVFDAGYKVVTSYRNSKNYGTNWVSAGSSLWFLREAKYMNNARMILGTSCAVSGTGFLVSDEIIKDKGGWKYHMLTEDIEFTMDSTIGGGVIGYADKAHIYDEQPTSFAQSWVQRERWTKGFYQVFGKYGLKLAKTAITKRSFSCFDMFLTLCPALVISVLDIIVNGILLIIGLFNMDTLPRLVGNTAGAILGTIGSLYLILLLFGVIITITEWQYIKASAKKKVIYTTTFPLFMFTYIPIYIAALFKKVEWKPIHHSVSKSIEEMENEQ